MEKITIFAEQHSLLLKSIDRSIQIIRIATSVQLGLGPWSLSVDRVDANLSYKQNPKIYKTLNITILICITKVLKYKGTDMTRNITNI